MGLSLIHIYRVATTSETGTVTAVTTTASGEFTIQGLDAVSYTHLDVYKRQDSYYATYTVTVKPEALAAMQANNVDVKNRYYVHVSNAKSNFGDALNRYWDSANVGNYKWDEKIVRTGTTLDPVSYTHLPGVRV